MVISESTATRRYGDTPWPHIARAAGAYPEGSFYNDLAYLASYDRFNASQLIGLAHGWQPEPTMPRLDPSGVAWLGYVTASRVSSASRTHDALALFNLAYHLGGARVLRGSLATVWLQCAALCGKFRELAPELRDLRASGDAWWAAATDDHHPTHSANGDMTRWLESFNAPLAQFGLEPVTLADRDVTMFERLLSHAKPPKTDSMPLVSVVVPVFNPDNSFVSAVQSLRSQTWTNIEIILSDDASTKNASLISLLAQTDDRIKVISSNRNAGAYAARNAGIKEARGTFITFNDADDWSHPDRIRRQVESLMRSNAARANVSQSIRVKSDLSLTVIGRPPTRINLSSLLMRRTDFLTNFGGFDAVRRGADSEFVSRFEARFGTESLQVLEEPLAYVQLTDGSLSRADYRHLYTHPARLQYRDNFRNWHRSPLRKKSEFHYMPPNRPPFPAPSHISGDDVVPINLDVLMLGNVGGESPTSLTMAEEIGFLNSSGFQTGVLEYLSPHDLAERLKPPQPSLAESIRLGETKWLLAGTPVNAAVVVIRDPEAIDAMPSSIFDSISTENVVIFGASEDREHPKHSIHRITSVVKQKLNVTPRWFEPKIESFRTRTKLFSRRRGSLIGISAHTGSLNRKSIAEDPKIGLWLPAYVHLSERELTKWIKQVSSACPGSPVYMWGPSSAAKTVGADVVELFNSKTAILEDFMHAIDVFAIPPKYASRFAIDSSIIRSLVREKIVIGPREISKRLPSTVINYEDKKVVSSLLAGYASCPVLKQDYIANALAEVDLESTKRRYLDGLLLTARHPHGEGSHGPRAHSFKHENGELPPQ